MTPEQIEHIEKIVERVLQENIDKNRHVNNKLLAIIGATQRPLEQPLQQLQTCTQNGWNIRIILSELATKVVDLALIHEVLGEANILQENELTNIPSIVDEYTQIVLPALSYPMAGKLALKLVDTPSTYLIFHALSCGKQVIAAADFLNRRELLNKKSLILDEIEHEHVNTLSEFGVKWVTVEQIAATIGEVDATNRISINTPVISVAVIANLPPNIKELVYVKSTVITPLAREHAKKMGIRLIPER